MCSSGTIVICGIMLCMLVGIMHLAMQTAVFFQDTAKCTEATTAGLRVVCSSTKAYLGFNVVVKQVSRAKPAQQPKNNTGFFETSLSTVTFRCNIQ